ncbi:MAG: hypothetical protein ACE5JI_22045, partial [Acidobacteriota bacterium]
MIRARRFDVGAASRFLLLSYAWLGIMGCARSRHENGLPVFFVEHLDQAEADFDPVKFRSVRKDGLLSSQVTMGGETLLSLTPPLPSRLTYRIEIPSRPALRFSIGAKRLGDRPLPAPVDFRLYIGSGAGEELGFSHTIPRSQPDHWVDQEVDLSRWAGKRVRLTFETRLAKRKKAP